MRDRFPINQDQKEAAQNSAVSKEYAKKLLSMPEFDRYKKQAERDLENLTNIIRHYKDPDPLKYAFFIQAKIKELNQCMWLLEKVETESGVNNAKN